MKQVLDKALPETICCDHCGEPDEPKRMYHYEKLPFDTAYTAAGESASVCVLCQKVLSD